MENFSLAQKIQIGLLGVIAVLLVLQLSGVFGSDSSAIRQQAANELQSTGANAVTPAQPAIQPNPAVQPQTPPVPTGPTTTMTFEESTYNFGSVTEGEKVEHVYKFKNTGNDPLIISNAQGSCGCTVPQWPREPIAPGKSSEIKVVFDSKGKAGKQSKTVSITANTEPATTTITISGEVLKNATTPPSSGKSASQPIQITPGNK